MSMDYNWEPKGAPDDSNWLDDDLGDVMGLLDKDYSPARTSGMDVHIPLDDGGDDLDYIKFILEKDSVRNKPLHQQAPAEPVLAVDSLAGGDDMGDIMGLLDLDYSKPQPPQQAAPVMAAPVMAAPAARSMPKAEPAHQTVPRTEAADDLADILGILDRDYSKPQPAKAAPASHNGGLDDMDFIPGFDDFPDVDWGDSPAPKAGKNAAGNGRMKAFAPKAPQQDVPSKKQRNPYPVKSDPSTAVRQGKDKLFPVLLGTAAAQVVAIAVIWVLWLL